MTIIKKVLLISFGFPFLLSSCNSNGQGQKIDKIDIVQTFLPGTKYLFEVQRGKIDSKHPKIKDIKSSTAVEFTILLEKKGIYECAWKYGSTKVIGINPDLIDEQTKKFMNVHQGIEVKFNVDKSGAIKEITNYDECKIYIENAFKVILENAPNKATPEQYSNMMKALKSSYATPEILVSTYCPELTVFFMLFGETIKSDTIYISKSYLPNPFGGRSFPSNVTTKVDSLKENIALISVKQTIPENDLNAIMEETFIELSKLSKKPFLKNEIPKMNMATSAVFSYDYNKKVMKEVYSEKLIETAGNSQTQTLKVKLKN